MGGDLLEKILSCFDDSFVRTAGGLVALADVDHEDWLTDGATKALNSRRLQQFADLFRADMVSPLSAVGELRKMLRPQDPASLRVEAWAVLQAMDRALGAEWLSKFRSEGALKLEAGSLFPIGHCSSRSC